MQTVVETDAYLRSAKAVGMTPAEMRAVVDTVAADPLAGDLIVGSGGCRKVRVAGRGKGKSGGYRVVTYFGAPSFPVSLLAVLSKGSDGNFSHTQVNALAAAAKTITASFGGQAGADL